jgi:hypothetical protein
VIVTTWLRDVIAIPERAGADDYVLRLTEGVASGRLERTVEEYVVTDQIAEAFDQALDLVGAALKDRQSRAAFLAGSFGSGKSHFMAVLHALLGRDPAARAKAELAPLLARHDDVLGERKILRLAYHFLESRSVEETLLGGYVAQIQALHPDADLPAVHRGEAVIADGEKLRGQLGDDAYLAGLNQHGSACSDPWGAVLEGDAPWTADSYDAARSAAPGSEARQRLVSALVRAYFTAYTQTAEFVSVDEGLAAISEHARRLGYDAVVMFLDELVLWLAFSVRNRELFGREAQKLTKLVESGAGERAVPIISLVARQMDLRRYFVDTGGGMGAEQDALDNAFRHQEGRFSTIVLGDDNLPYVAQRRLLRPVDDGAQAVLDDAFARLDRRPEVWDVLLDGANVDDQHRGADQAAFRMTYPFSPALVSTLRTLASAMQRDRTALKVMQQLLVRRREALTVDDVIPVGDVFDLVVDGNQALSPEMAGRFKNARTLYADKLRPLLLREHALAPPDVAALPADHAFHADDRLVKTLVLSAIAPEVPALKELTAGRLAALNHGSIVSPLPGQEATVVLSKVRRWAGDVPEIHVNGGIRNPVVRVRIAEVDYESVVQKARGEDNDGRRRETLKRLVWEALDLSDIAADAFGVTRQPAVWRGSRRDVEVVFGNIRDTGWLPDSAFEAGAGTWRLVIDYPFDEQGRSAAEDLARLDDLRGRGVVNRTIGWVPRTLSRERRDELGRLVILDWVLGGPGDRWTQNANHLSEADRVQARTILESQQESLRDRLRRAIQEAYGAATPTPGTLESDEAHDRVLVSLHPQLSPAAPVGHDLAAAFRNLIDQAFSATYPGHPRFEPEDRDVRLAELTAVLDAAERAHQDRDGRAFVETGKRDAVRRVANPLGVGHMGETHFLFGSERFRWSTEFSRAMGRSGIGPHDPVQVRVLREWVEAIEPPAGLRPEVADLVICAWAVLQDRAWYRYGSPTARPAPGELKPEMELRPEPLPAAGDWEAAVPRAGALFGLVGNTYLTGAAVAELTERVQREAAARVDDAEQLVPQLSAAYSRLGLPADLPTGRLATATAARDVVASLRTAADRVALVEDLARADLPGTDQAVAKSLSTADQVGRALDGYAWDRLRPLLDGAAGTDERAKEAAAALERLRAALTADELAQPLEPALRRAEDDAFRWLNASVTTTLEPQPKPDMPGPAARGRRDVRSSGDLQAAFDELRTFAAEHSDGTVVVEWRAE